jgi:hypothetical protein
MKLKYVVLKPVVFDIICAFSETVRAQFPSALTAQSVKSEC